MTQGASLLWRGVAAFGLFLSTFSVADAHVKWFVSAEEVGGTSIEPYHLSEPAVQIWMVALILGLTTAAFLEKKLPPPAWSWFKKLQSKEKIIIGVFQALVGAALIWSATQNQLLVPLFESTPLFNAIEGLAGILLILQWAPVVPAVLLLGLWATLLWSTPHGIGAWEYLHFVGIAAFLLLKRPPPWKFIQNKSAWAMPILRLCTGIALLVLAFTEKLASPAQAVTLLGHYNLNFMQPLGFTLFDDRLFTLSAGSSELLFALIFLTGWITRLNTVALAFFLIASNVYFFAMGQPHEGFIELVGHLPIVAIALLFVMFGSGEKLKLPPHHRSS